jgi:hypothetical protein
MYVFWKRTRRPAAPQLHPQRLGQNKGNSRAEARRSELRKRNNYLSTRSSRAGEGSIRTELGWTDSMIHSLLQNPDSPNARRDKFTGGYTYGLYRRDRVLAVAQSTEGKAAKRRWDETLHGDRPNPGWTTRLGDIGGPLCITAVAAGKILELLGYRSKRHVTDAAFSAGCGVRRWDGFAMHDDWHLDRVVCAIRFSARDPGKPEVADALAAAVASRQARARVAAKRRLQEEAEIKRRQEEQALVSVLQVELQMLRSSDPGMTLLTAVEYITPDPARRIALYRGCHAEDYSIGAAKDLALLERRAQAEGFQV